MLVTLDMLFILARSCLDQSSTALLVTPLHHVFCLDYNESSQVTLVIISVCLAIALNRYSCISTYSTCFICCATIVTEHQSNARKLLEENDTSIIV